MTATPPSIAVVLATYNGASYLRTQLVSLFQQVRLPKELLVGDDCSSDTTRSVLEAMLPDAPFPTRVVYRSERLGYGDNFLSLAMDVDADLVAFCDQDDLWYPEKLERMADVFRNPEVVLAAHHVDVVDAAGESLKRVFPRDGLAGVFGTELPFGVYPGLALTARRDLLSGIDYRSRPRWGRGGGTSDRVGHDSWLWLAAPCLGKTVILSDRLAAYRQHQNLYGDAHLPVRSRVSAGNDSRFAGAAAWQEEIAAYLSGLAVEWETCGEPDRAMRALDLARRRRAYAAYLRRRAAIYQATSVGAGVKSWTALASNPSGMKMWGHLRCLAKDGLSLPRMLFSREGGRARR